MCCILTDAYPALETRPTCQIRQSINMMATDISIDKLNKTRQVEQDDDAESVKSFHCMLRSHF